MADKKLNIYQVNRTVYPEGKAYYQMLHRYWCFAESESAARDYHNLNKPFDFKDPYSDYIEYKAVDNPEPGVDWVTDANTMTAVTLLGEANPAITTPGIFALDDGRY